MGVSSITSTTGEPLEIPARCKTPGSCCSTSGPMRISSISTGRKGECLFSPPGPWEANQRFKAGRSEGLIGNVAVVIPPCFGESVQCYRACLILSAFALSRRGLRGFAAQKLLVLCGNLRFAQVPTQHKKSGSRRELVRPSSANNVVCDVENALRAFSTSHTKSGERRRREPASWMQADRLIEIQVTIYTYYS